MIWIKRVNDLPDDRPSVRDAIEKAVDAIKRLNGMLPRKQRKIDALEWIGDPVAETTLSLFCDGEY